MVSSVFNIAVTGLTTAQAGLSAISNNISNAGTKGYSRQDLVQTAAQGIETRIGYMGTGVALDDVRRASSSFLNAKLNESIGSENFFKAYDQQISQLDAVLSDDVNGVAAGFTGFFTALQDLTTRPGDLAARESVMTSARTVAGRINGVATTVDRIRDSTNGALQGAVDAINGISAQLADLNIKITDTMNRGSGSSPNDLLDKRDMLMQELSSFVSNTVIENGDGTFNIYLQSGQPLVSKNKFSEFTVLRDPFNPQNIQIGLVQGKQTASPTTTRYDAQALGEGKIAGLLQMRDGDLPQYRNIMGVIASQFADRINTLQREGFDLNGVAGENLFQFQAGAASRAVGNPSGAQAAIGQVFYGKVSANDYEVINDNGTFKYRVANTRDLFAEATVVSAGSPMVLSIGEEFEFSVSGASQNGDRFLLQPTARAASSLVVNADLGPSEIAAGRTAGAKGDNSNLQKMAALQTSTVELTAFGAKQDVTLTSAFNQLVSKVGNRTREIQDALATRTAVRESAEAQQQDLSGVNLDEEAANLLKYQQAYQAAGQVIAMSKDLFDQLLNALG